MKYTTCICDKCAGVVNPGKHYTISSNRNAFFGTTTTPELDLCSDCYEDILTNVKAHVETNSVVKMPNNSETEWDIIYDEEVIKERTVKR